MLEIFCALYIEAKPLIEHLQLKKTFCIKGHDSFMNVDASIRLTITGSGKINACSSVARVLETCHADTVVLSYGSCAYLNEVHEDVYIAHRIGDIDTCLCFYPDVLYQTGIQECTFLSGSRLLSTKTNPRESIICQNDLKQQLLTIQQQLQDVCVYDTETSAIYETCNQFLGPHQIYCVRFPTDTDASKVNIDDICKKSEAVYAKVERLITILVERKQQNITESIEETNIRIAFEQHIYATKAMQQQIQQMIKYCKIMGIEYMQFMQMYMQLEVTSKQEGKQIFHEFIHKCCEE